jgi:hypothetical protein
MPILDDVVSQIGSLTTTSTTANQIVKSYTVPVGRVLLLSYFHMMARSTSPPGNSNPVVFGEASLEVDGVKRFTVDILGNVSPREHGLNLCEPWQVPAGLVVRVVCTPASGTSFLWRANFGGALA